MAKFTNKDLRLKDGQKVTWGTDLDSNIWWDDTNAELRLDTVISGVTPTKPDHLTPRFYVDDAVSTASGSLQDQISGLTMDHGELEGLGDDDHTQYVPTDGSRGFTSTVSGVDPTADYDLATKGYLDEALATLSGGIVQDHGGLVGLGDDDHTQYSLADGTRAFTGVVGGITPTADDHLTTKQYVDGEIDTISGSLATVAFSGDHGDLTGLGDDDHTIYTLADGTRAFTGVVGGITPTADNHLTTKSYVDLAIQGLDWQQSVLDSWTPSTGLPVGPTTGDRYLAEDSGNGWTAGNVYEWDGSAWDEQVPNDGSSVWNEAEDVLYVYNGTDWVRFGSTITHNNTNGLQGGDSDEYYHMTSAQYEALTDNNSNVDDASSQHHHDSRYYTETEMDATLSGITDSIADNLANTVTLDGDQTITGNKTFDNSGTTTFLGDVFFNGIEITMSGTTLNTESGAVFNYDDSTTINNDGTTNYTSTATVNNAGETNYTNGSTVDYESGSTITHESGSNENHESGSTETFESGSETVHESGSNDTYLPGSNLTLSGTNVDVTGDTTVTYGPETTINNEGTTNFESGSETIFYPGSSVTFSGTTNFDGTITGISHGDLEDLGNDDHTQYILTDGSRGFTNTVSGVTPVAGSDLATKDYVDGADNPQQHGRESLGNGVSSVTINFTDVGTTSYTVTCTLENTADSPPSIYPFIVSGKTSSSFTVTFAGDMDSTNYVLDWVIFED